MEITINRSHNKDLKAVAKRNMQIGTLIHDISEFFIKASLAEGALRSLDHATPECKRSHDEDAN